MIETLAILILAAQPSGDMGAKYTEAVEIYACDFGEASDLNFDNWPDRWTRRRGKDFPHYVKIGIKDREHEFPQILPNPMPSMLPNPPMVFPGKAAQSFLEIELNGGSAVVSSPIIEISPTHSYVLEAKLHTERILNNKAFFEVAFYDDAKELVEKHTSPTMSRVDDWKTVVVGPITPHSEFIKWVRIRLHLHKAAKADLFGKAMFDDIWLGQLPRMKLLTKQPFNVYNDPQDVEVACEVSGISDEEPRVRFELLDVNGNLVDERVQRIPTYQVSSDSLEDFDSGATTGKRFAGRIDYLPPAEKLGYGFFKIRASIIGNSSVRSAGHRGMMMQRELTLVVMRPLPQPPKGEFGWTLPDGEGDLEFVTLANLLQNAGVNWVKFPVWYGEENYQRAEDLAAFAERLSLVGIELIGLLDHPPESTWQLLGKEEGGFLIASVFEDDAIWRRIIDPVLTRLALKVRWWQIGADDDLSFVGFPKESLDQKLTLIREHMERFGQEVKLGIAWNWLYARPELQRHPLQFTALTSAPPFTSDEIRAYLDEPEDAKASKPNEHPVRRWVQLQPLSKRQYRIGDRAVDLVARMLAAKACHADGIFVPDPFDPETGLMNRDGTPGELLLPWRTTAFILAGAKYLGEVNMPNGSRNSVFVRNGQGIMAVWNDHPTEEVIYLGKNVVQVDLWGRQSQLSLQKQPSQVYPASVVHRQKVHVDRFPSFLIGVNPFVAQWRINFAFQNERLTSTFGQAQSTKVQMRNSFPRGVGGTFNVQTPSSWKLQRPRHLFRVGANDSVEEELHIKLGTNASSGSRPVQIDFDLTAGQNYRFSVFRQLQVGLGDVTIELSTSLAQDGNLIVEQTIENKSEKRISFNCYLFAPKRRRLRQQVLELEHGRTSSTFVLTDGKSLLGKQLWLRAEEIYGKRILNYQVTAEP